MASLFGESDCHSQRPRCSCGLLLYAFGWLMQHLCAAGSLCATYMLSVSMSLVVDQSSHPAGCASVSSVLAGATHEAVPAAFHKPGVDNQTKLAAVTVECRLVCRSTQETPHIGGPAGTEVPEQGGPVQPCVCVVVWCACALWLPLGVTGFLLLAWQPVRLLDRSGFRGCSVAAVSLLLSQWRQGLDAAKSLLHQFGADAVQELPC
jgi:hypothetical protein